MKILDCLHVLDYFVNFNYSVIVIIDYCFTANDSHGNVKFKDQTSDED